MRATGRTPRAPLGAASRALSALCRQAVLERKPRSARVCTYQQLQEPPTLPGGPTRAPQTPRGKLSRLAAGIVCCSLTKMGPGPGGVRTRKAGAVRVHGSIHLQAGSLWIVKDSLWLEQGIASEREMPKPCTPGPHSGFDARGSLERREESKAIFAISQKIVQLQQGT